MRSNTQNLRNAIGLSDTTLFADGKDIYLVIEQDDFGDLSIPHQALFNGGRAAVLADLMLGNYDCPVKVIRWKSDGTWEDVSTCFASFWFLTVLGQNTKYIGALPHFLDAYLHPEFRPDWLVNELA